jgi:hypothetical protein
MAGKQHWAAVLSLRPFSERLDDPHPASTAVVINGFTFCSTILPWRGSGGEHPWIGENHCARTKAAIETLLGKLPASNLVWGGDWNHSLHRKELAGSMGGRDHVLDAISKLSLRVPTEFLMHQTDACYSIDHIGVPSHWRLVSEKRIRAKGCSDHDAYVIEVEQTDLGSDV